jgi:dipeptidyl aminopeptidase/acylaminoacyl peptidase
MHFDRRGPQTVWFDPRYRVIQAALQKSFPGRLVTILGSDLAEEQFFIRVFSDVAPPSYFHVKPGTKTFSRIADEAPWIDPARMHAMQTITYKSRDGREIEGYVTLPDGASQETPVPLVVLPHGGPWVRDTWGWDPEVQFLASRGYAVFQPNYRGSDGTAWRFSPDDLWAFRSMHNDVTDGVQTVLRTRLIDADRIAIMGWSFGAYLALCGAAYEPDMYRCAITLAGVYDWEDVVKQSRGSVYARGRYGRLKLKLGDPRKEAENFEAISPLRSVSDIRIPVFVAHGSEDPVANIAQSRRLISALKKNRVPYETKIERSEGHGFYRLENRVELYTELEEFLAKHLAPRTVPVGVATGN